MTIQKTYSRPFAEAAFVVLGAILAISSAPAASAQSTEFKARFSYDRNAAAPAVYAGLVRDAEKACTTPGVRSVRLQRIDTTCTADLLDKVVARIGRADIAELHHRTPYEVAGNRAETEPGFGRR